MRRLAAIRLRRIFAASAGPSRVSLLAAGLVAGGAAAIFAALRPAPSILAAGLLAAGLATAGLGTDAGGDPTAPVERLHAGLDQAMRRADELGFEGRFTLLDPVLAGSYDLDWMAAKSLGRYWKKLSMEERTRWAALFRKLTVSTYADRFDGFSGERFELLSVEPSAQDTMLVHTRIVPTDKDPVALDYRVRAGDNGFRIIDVYLEGTVSGLALRRSDYSSLVKREGFDSLVTAIEEKIGEAQRGTDPD
jgi:phospholipid transport system substrate-binding protein